MLSKGAIIALIAIVVIVIAVVVVAASSTPQATTSPVTVTINNEPFTGDPTATNSIDWGTTSPGNTYTRPFWVQSNSDQNLTLQLFTTEPAGCTQTWIYNNTVLPPQTQVQGTLVLTVSTSGQTGTYTWQLLATNGTITPQTSPTPTPTSTPDTPYKFTLNKPDTGMQNINVTINADKFTFVPSTLPETFNYKQGDTITFKTATIDGYAFNYWRIDDTPAGSTNSYTITNAMGNFTVTAVFLQIPIT